MLSVRDKIRAGITLGFFFAVVCFGGTRAPRAQVPSMSEGGKANATPWRPNSKTLKYLGAAVCAKCHKEESAFQHTTSMGTALEPAATSRVLSAHQLLSFKSGPYAYQIVRKGNQSLYTVTDGTNTFSEPIDYAFGQGKAGQTYVFRHNGSFEETRVSYYRDTENLDWTLGYPSTVPPSLEVAAGRALSSNEVTECFTCHGTGGTNGGELVLDKLVPGVTCEACHGPGGDHVASMEAKDFKNKHIFNPSDMGPDDMAQEFCGSCHRSAEKVAENPRMQGVNSVRFQPYRMFTSRGHDPGDPRLSCTSCHNPHKNPEHETAFYDSKCLACHHSASSLKSPEIAKAETGQGQTDKACPVGKDLCVSCHMPKIEIPGSHFHFTDHRIRIARPGDPFPN
jgi:hypothetical protein